MPTKRIRGRALQRLRASILRANPICVVCDRSGYYRPATQIDHVLPLGKDGTNDRDNLQPLCDACHREKTAADMGYKLPTAVDARGYPIGGHHWNEPNSVEQPARPGRGHRNV